MTRRTVAQGVAGAAAMIAVLTLLARLAGFGRTLVFTNTVGADSTGDTYLAANTVPNIVFEVVAGGALASLVVPMLAGGIAVGDREQVRRTASALLGWTLLVLTPLAVRDRRVRRADRAAAARRRRRRPRSTLAARFLLVFAPQVVLYGIGIVLTGVLQAHRRFAGPALAPLLSSVVVAGAYLALRRASAAAGTSTDLATPGRARARRGDDARRGGPEPEPAGPGARAAAWACGPSLRFPVGAAPRVRRLALAGVLTLAGQQLVAVVAIRLANDGAPDGTQVVYAAGLTLFLVPWAALAVPLATSAYPGLAERADARRRAGLPPARWPRSPCSSSPPSAVAAALLVAVAGPDGAGLPAQRARTRRSPRCATRSIAFAPGLRRLRAGRRCSPGRSTPAGSGRRRRSASSAAGWSPSSPTSSSPRRCRPPDRGLALGAGHTPRRHRRRARPAGRGGPRGRARGALAGLPRAGTAALAAAAARAARPGSCVSRALGADPVPDGGVLAAVGVGRARRSARARRRRWPS